MSQLHTTLVLFIVFKSPLCKAVAHALAPLLISAKSDIVACTAIFHVHNTLVLFIVFMLVPLTRASCFQLNVAKSSFVRYQSALLVAAQSLVFIVAVVSSHVLAHDRVVIQSFVFIVLAVSSHVLVPLVFDNLVLSALVKNRFVDHSVKSSLSVGIAKLTVQVCQFTLCTGECVCTAHFNIAGEIVNAVVAVQAVACASVIALYVVLLSVNRCNAHQLSYLVVYWNCLIAVFAKYEFQANAAVVHITGI
jgi:hypothetical protein